jgi:hypothetical protein
MTTKRSIERMLMFYVGCIGSRLLLALIALYIAHSYSPLAEVLGTLMAFGLVSTTLVWVLLAIGVFHRDNGLEVFNADLWWKHWRWFHALTYFMAGVLLLNPNRTIRAHAWKVLFFDALIGATVYTVHTTTTLHSTT